MGGALTVAFRITTEWRREVDDDLAGMPGSAVDEATLSQLSIEVAGDTLTWVQDRVTGDRRKGANLSAHGLAEWLVWNWWRLRWEPTDETSVREGWRDAHDLAGIGGGWLWPNITIHTDGMHVLLAAKSSQPTRTELLSYTTDLVWSIPAAVFEAGIDHFVRRVLERLDGCSLGDTDLHTTWRELSVERNDPDLSSYRKFEACLGFDPDEAEPETIERLLTDSESLGEAAMTEIAAHHPSTGPALSAQDLRREARSAGFDTNPRDGVQKLAEAPRGKRDRMPAWHVGVEAARCLRRQEDLGDGPVSDRRLAALYGIQEPILKGSSRKACIAFALGENGESRTALRANRPTGRRFELARLLADRLLFDEDERLHPATRTYTYRQKMQRAFAGEFLCPIDSLIDYLDGDYSDDAKEDAADRFHVSPLAVTTLLVSNGLIDRREIHERSVLSA